MSLSLYDPLTQTIIPVAPGPSAPPTCADTEGPNGLHALRQAVLEDLVQRQQLAQPGSSSTPLKEQLRSFTASVLDGACEPESLRYWLASVHYRAPMALAPRAAGELGYPQLDAAERELASLYAARKRLLELPPERIVPVQTPPSDALSCFPDALSQALEHDLDTPRALAALASFLVAVNTLCDGVMRKQGRANASLLESARAGVSTALGSLGVGAEDPSAFLTRVRDRRAQRAQLDVAAIDAVVAERSAARSARDFATADRLQAQLLAQGVQLLDAPSGTSWTLH